MVRPTPGPAVRTSASAGEVTGDDPWLVIIDPQRIFASSDSPWCAPRFASIESALRRLARMHLDRTVVTRWVPGADHSGSWVTNFERWQFADRPASDGIFDLVDAMSSLTSRPTLDLATFGKWGPELSSITGDTPHLLLAGVATDCCIISTALAAADAGATVTVLSDVCAGSSDQNHQAALHVMQLYAPQIEVRTLDQLEQVG